jgi:hypothetical protein
LRLPAVQDLIFAAGIKLNDRLSLRLRFCHFGGRPRLLGEEHELVTLNPGRVVLSFLTQAFETVFGLIP